MADEPTNSELAWRLDRIQDTLVGLVGHPEYLADKRAADYRMAEIERRIAEEARERAADVEALHQRISDQAKAGAEHRMQWRSLLWTGALPALVTLIGVIVSIWIAHQGGGH